MRTIMRRVRRMNPARSAAQIGNQNAAKPDGSVKESFLSTRCMRSDKSAWIQAANKADAKGKLDRDGRQKSVLASWVIMKLNAAADRENDPKDVARRRKAEAERKEEEGRAHEGQ